ncbi:MAG TPA: hypothetical protein DIT07_08295 [Sphingobacteriaceae bacterium]|nr:hypothetical protein [Sphingobacteriaceae bacterium]
MMNQSWQKRYNSRLTGDIKIAKWLSLSSQIAYQRTFRTQDDGITRSTAEAWAILPTKYPDSPEYTIKAGKWGANQDFNIGEQWYNINFIRASDYGRVLRQQTTGNVDLNGKITKDLGFKTSFSADLNTQKSDGFSGIKYGTSNGASVNADVNAYWQATAFFNYDKTIGDHTINAVAGTEVSENINTFNQANNSTFFSDWYGYHNLAVGTATRPGVASGDSRSALNSYFARANYSYKGKYMLTATARYDGSSKFGPSSKYGFFPSAGIAWNATQEDFMKDIPVISNLKLRASYGKTGNQDINGGAVFGFANASNVFLGNAVVPGIVPGAVGNNNLHWESTAQYDGGIEVGVFKGRVNFDVDYYQKETSDLLLNVALPQSTTTGNILLNYGAVENKGWEFSLNTQNFNGADFRWSTTGTVALNRNKIKKLGPLGADIPNDTGAGNATSVYRVGAPIGSFFGLNRLGTWGTNEAAAAARYSKVPGDLKFADTNQDGKIDVLIDGNITGNAWPKAVIGFNNNFTYKNFDAGVDISIVRGVNKAFVHESAEDRQLVSGGLNTTLTAWRPDNQNAQVAQIRPGNSGPYYQSFPDTHEIYDASFIRGSSATLGFRFPKELVNKIAVQNARIYFTASNFFLITKAAGYDPEGNSLDKNGTNAQNAPGQDKYLYPNPTTMTLGLKIGF